MAVGPQILPENVPPPGPSLPEQVVTQAGVQLVPSPPPPGLVKDPASQSQRKRWL